MTIQANLFDLKESRLRRDEGIARAEDKAEKDSPEVWKDVKGYEGKYMVSNIGRMKSLTRGRFKKEKYIVSGKVLKLQTDTTGYLSVILTFNGKHKRCAVHRMVAEAFVPNIENKPQVNHLDGNRVNANCLNLEWCTVSENLKHMAKRPGYVNSMQGKKGVLNHNSKPVVQKCISGDTIKIWDSRADAARDLKICNSDISSCTTGKKKTAGGYKWENTN